jgi:hypothetical protein
MLDKMKLLLFVDDVTDFVEENHYKFDLASGLPREDYEQAALSMSPKDFFAAFLDWNGIHGYAADLWDLTQVLHG